MEGSRCYRLCRRDSTYGRHGDSRRPNDTRIRRACTESSASDCGTKARSTEELAQLSTSVDDGRESPGVCVLRVKPNQTVRGRSEKDESHASSRPARWATHRKL